MYQSILIADELRDYLPLLCRFLSGERGGLKSEKLRDTGNHAIYSLRANQSTRLLYTIASVRGVKSMIVLGEVLSHDYHKSRFLRASGALEAYLQKHQDVIEKVLKDDAFEPAALNADDTFENIDEPVVQDHYPLKAFGTRLFFEDANQEASFKNEQAKTVIISGSSGTGKTVSAMLYLQSHAGALRSDGQPKKYLYVSASTYLVDDVKKQMQAALSAEQLKTIDFKTYTDLAKEEQASVDSNTEWIERDKVVKSITNSLKRGSKDWSLFGGVSNVEDATQVVHDEWILLAGLDGSLKEYLKLGDDQSYIKNETTRQWIHELFEDFQKTSKDNQIYLPFHRINDKTACYDGVIIDEAYLLSFANVKSLSARADFTMLLGDSHQAIGAHWLSVFTSRQKDGVSHIPLRENFRNPSSVIDALNRLLQVKYFIRPGLRDKYEQGHIHSRQVNSDTPLRWIDDDWCSNHQDIIKGWTGSTDFAVVMLCDETKLTIHDIEAKKNKLRKRFNTPLIFTRREIQGLEYPVVTVVIDSTIDLINKSLNRGFASELLAQDKSAPITRGDEKGVTYNAQRAMDVTNQLYVGFSRAQSQLVVYVDDKVKEKAAELIGFYKGEATAKPNQAIATQEILLNSSEASWAQEKERQEKLGNLAIASSIVNAKQTSKPQEKPSAKASSGPSTHSKSPSPQINTSKPVSAPQENAIAQKTKVETQVDTVLKEPAAYTAKWKKIVQSFRDPNKINQENIKRICQKDNIELINWVLFGAEVEEGKKDSIFIRYLNKYKIDQFLKGIDLYKEKISPQGMNHMKITDAFLSGVSLASCICVTELGQDFLEKNPAWFDMFSDASLGAIPSSLAGNDEGKTILYVLCSTEKGRSLLTKHPEWFARFDTHNINHVISSGPCVGKSAVFMLCSSDWGQAQLMKNPELFETFHIDTLNHIIPYGPCAGIYP